MFHPLCCVGMNEEMVGAVEGHVKDVVDSHASVDDDTMIEGLQEGKVHVESRPRLRSFSLCKMLIF